MPRECGDGRKSCGRRSSWLGAIDAVALCVKHWPRAPDCRSERTRPQWRVWARGSQRALFRSPQQPAKPWDMETAYRVASEPNSRASRGRALLLVTFTATVILSAALLFLVQPMFTKLVLPRFGGAPSVWSVAIVFFQTALLAGYAYAHWLTRYASGRPSVALHFVVMTAAVLALPPAIASGWERPPSGTEPLWLIALFTRPIVHYCRRGSRAPIIPPPETPISSMPPAMWEAFSRLSHIRP